MTKKSTKDRDTDDEKDLEEEETEDETEEEEDSDDDEEEEEEEEEEEAHAAPVQSKATRERARSHASHGHGHSHADEDDEDPYWWAPHAVLSVLVLVGVLGFFGAFNKILGPVFGKPATPPAEEHTTAHQAAEPQPPMPNPHQQQQPQPQPQRELFGAKHLLVMYKGSLRAPPNIERTKEEAKARATEAMKKAKEGKIKFEDLVKEYSDEPGAGARGGDLGRFPKGAMVPEFQEAVEKLKVGGISDIVETKFGYHVILRTQ